MAKNQDKRWQAEIFGHPKDIGAILRALRGHHSPNAAERKKGNRATLLMGASLGAYVALLLVDRWRSVSSMTLEGPMLVLVSMLLLLGVWSTVRLFGIHRNTYVFASTCVECRAPDGRLVWQVPITAIEEILVARTFQNRFLMVLLAEDARYDIRHRRSIDDALEPVIRFGGEI